MRHKRSLFRERRHDNDMPRVPFKDSNGVIIKECRRKSPDRRISNIQAKRINEVVISQDRKPNDGPIPESDKSYLHCRHCLTDTRQLHREYPQ